MTTGRAGRRCEIEQKAVRLEDNIDQAKDATASTWDNIKATTRESYDALKNSFNDARQTMSDRAER